MYFARSERALLRYGHHGVPNFIAPTTIVEDSAKRTMLYLAAGTQIKARVLPDGSSPARNIPYAQRLALDRVMRDVTWTTNNALIIWQPGWAWDVRLFWRADSGVFSGWYINLQDPLVRHGNGFDPKDHLLDITVDPHGTPHWKDEDELTDATHLGRFSREEAKAIRTAGERALGLVADRAWPFDGALIDWKPDPAWPVPSIPEAWSLPLVSR